MRNCQTQIINIYEPYSRFVYGDLHSGCKLDLLRLKFAGVGAILKAHIQILDQIEMCISEKHSNWCNDTQHYNTHHNDIKNNDTQHKWPICVLSISDIQNHNALF